MQSTGPAGWRTEWDAEIINDIDKARPEVVIEVAVLQVRRDKRDRLLAEGKQPFPVTVPRTHTLGQVREQWGHLETGEETQDVVGVAGRKADQRGVDQNR